MTSKGNMYITVRPNEELVRLVNQAAKTCTWMYMENVWNIAPDLFKCHLNLKVSLCSEDQACKTYARHRGHFTDPETTAHLLLERRPCYDSSYQRWIMLMLYIWLHPKLIFSLSI